MSLSTDFIGHIQAHLKDGQEVVCKICGKTAKEICGKAQGEVTSEERKEMAGILITSLLSFDHEDAKRLGPSFERIKNLILNAGKGEPVVRLSLARKADGVWLLLDGDDGKSGALYCGSPKGRIVNDLIDRSMGIPVEEGK